VSNGKQQMVKVIINRALGQLIRKPKLMRPPVLALLSVTSKTELGVYASSDTLFRGAVFGRDSLVVADDLMTLRPGLVKRILLTMARLQGLAHHSANEEEPGKIIHEYRTRVVDHKALQGRPLEIFEDLSSRWGGDNESLIYYGSVDSTPHFIRALCEYCDFYSPRILLSKVVRRDGQTVTMLDIMIEALDWLEDKLKNSKSGLLEYRAHNQEGIKNQAWKDSDEFYIHESGRFVNHSRPVASIEVQSLAYDALLAAAEYLPQRAEKLQRQAYKLRDRTIKLLWQEDKSYFALGCDYTQSGRLRIIRTTTANPASLLNSGFFDKLPAPERKKYISGIVRNIMGTDFLTDAGIRSRALSEANLIPFWDYHGSYVSWPKETFDIAKGLRRQGFPELAKQLENRLLNVVRKSRGYPEFLYVDPRGRVLGSSSRAHRHTHALQVKSTNVPESIQAWTVSATFAITADRRLGLRLGKAKQMPWQAELEKEVMTHIPKVARFKTSYALNARYPDYPYDLKEEHF
jgi:glycogen debranching enzyme